MMGPSLLPFPGWANLGWGARLLTLSLWDPALVGQSPSSSVRQRSRGLPTARSHPDICCTFLLPSVLAAEPSPLTFSPDDE